MKALRITSATLLSIVAGNLSVRGYALLSDAVEQYAAFWIVLLILYAGLNVLTISGTVNRWKSHATMIAVHGMILITWIATEVVIKEIATPANYLLGTIGVLLFISGIRLQQLTHE